MPNEKKRMSFKEFWPEYLRLHSRPATRAVHYAGTLAGIALAVAGIATGVGALIIAAPVVTYAVLFPSHFLFEKNNPATLKNPFLSVAGDFKLLGCFLTGRVRKEYEKAGLDFTGKTGNNKNETKAPTPATSRDNGAPSLISSLKNKLSHAFSKIKVPQKTAAVPAQKTALKTAKLDMPRGNK